MTDQARLSSFVAQLGLAPVRVGKGFIGVYDGVPLALTVNPGSDSVGWSFHVRHPLGEFAAGNPPLPPESSLAASVASKQAEVTCDKTISWLNLWDRGELTVEGIKQLLSEFFQTLTGRGIHLRPSICSRCNVETAHEPLFDEGRLELRCEPCKKAVREEFERETRLNPAQLPLILIPGILGMIGAALINGGFSYAVHWLLSLTGRIRVPVIAFFLLYMFVGLAAGLLIAYSISRVKNRGRVLPALIGLAFGCLAVVAGELIYVGVLCLREIGALPTPGVLPEIWFSVIKQLSIVLILGKLFSALAAIATSALGALPKPKV